MRKVFFILFVSIITSSAYAAEKITYLSCAKFDERAPDLIVVLDKAKGTASLQSSSSGSGLNFTAEAAFGPSEITWRKDSTKLKQTYSVNRSSLILKRKTFSEMTGNTYTDSSICTVKSPPRNNKI